MNMDYWIKVMWIELDSIYSLKLVEAPSGIKPIVLKLVYKKSEIDRFEGANLQSQD